MCVGTWVDDRAWVGLAELIWWEFTGKERMDLVLDAKYRYLDARNDGRLSNHEGFWSWYNWSLNANVHEHIYTNSNMNQMATLACKLYRATGEKHFFDDALLVWEGVEYSSLAAELYRIANNQKDKTIAVETVRQLSPRCILDST